MRLLLNTNAFIWWVADDAHLGPKARAAIASTANVVYMSNLSLLECAIKVRMGKLRIDFDAVDQEFSDGRLLELRFETHTARTFTTIDGPPHADPFDLAMIAHAVAKHLTLITSNTTILAFQMTDLHLLDARR